MRLKVPTLASAAAFALLAGLGVRPALAEATRPCAAAFLVEAPVAHWEGPCYGVGVSTTRRGDLQAASGVLRYTGTKLENLINVFGERKSATSKRISYVAIDSTGAHDFTSADAPPQYRWAVQRIEAVFANRWTPNTFVRPPGVQTAETGRSKP